MIKTRIISSILVGASLLLLAACASESRQTLLDKKFERAAATYDKYDIKGQTVYCRKGEPATFSQLPGWQCYNEAQLRRQVENYERSRNTNIGAPIAAGAGQGSLGG